jgi:hypothetical protein
MRRMMNWRERRGTCQRSLSEKVVPVRLTNCCGEMGSSEVLWEVTFALRSPFHPRMRGEWRRWQSSSRKCLKSMRLGCAELLTSLAGKSGE